MKSRCLKSNLLLCTHDAAIYGNVSGGSRVSNRAKLS